MSAFRPPPSAACDARRLRRARARPPSALLGLVLLAGAGCTLPVGPPPVDAAATPAPEPGDDRAALRAKAEAAPAAGTHVALESWRELRVDAAGIAGAGAPTDPDADAGTRALLAHRRCTRRVGWTESVETARSSWYLLDEGRLVAFDHASFDAECRPEWHLRPSPEVHHGVERALARYLAQRHPDARPSLGEELQRALPLLEAGREKEARGPLDAAERRLRRLEERLEQGGLSEEDRLALQEELDALRRDRDALVRALRDHEGADPPLPRVERGPADGEGRDATGVLLRPGAPKPRPADGTPEPPSETGPGG